MCSEARFSAVRNWRNAARALLHARRDRSAAGRRAARESTRSASADSLRDASVRARAARAPSTDGEPRPSKGPVPPPARLPRWPLRALRRLPAQDVPTTSNSRSRPRGFAGATSPGDAVAACVGSPRPYGYRSKLTPHFPRPRADRPRAIGFLEVGLPRRTVDVPTCPIAMPAVNARLAELRAEVHARWGPTGGARRCSCARRPRASPSIRAR